MGVGLLATGCGKKEKSSGTKLVVSEEKSSDTKLVVSAIPDENTTEQAARFKALSEYLNEKLDIEVEFTTAADYPATVQRFANGEIHMAWFGGVTGVQAREKVEGARAIAQGDVDPDYVSYFIAHKDTGLTKSDEFPTAIKDMTFTFGSKSSTSGRVMPTYFIENITLSKGSHEATANAVASGSVQVGVLSYKKYDSMVKKGDIKAEDAPIIWVTPKYADYNLTVHPDLEKMFGEGFIDKLQKALVDCDDPKVLAAFNRDKLIPAKNEDFAGIKKVAEAAGMLR
nr:probable ABC transporter phosphite binding protein PhnD1 [Nerophis lumbriciformis]